MLILFIFIYIYTVYIYIYIYIVTATAIDVANCKPNYISSCFIAVIEYRVDANLLSKLHELEILQWEI